MATVTPIKTPIGQFKWVVISGEGKVNMSGRMKYNVDLVLPEDSEEAKGLKAQIDAYWADNRPAKLPKGKPAKSLGYKQEKEPVLDEDGQKQYDEGGKVVSKTTGNLVFTFSTDTTYPSGDPKVINVFNAKKNKVSLGTKKVGNGSEGQVSGAMGIYVVAAPGKADVVTDAGVTLYLNSIRITKFLEFSGEESWEDAEEVDDGWTGDDSWEGDAEPQQAENKPVPKL